MRRGLLVDDVEQDDLGGEPEQDRQHFRDKVAAERHFTDERVADEGQPDAAVVGAK